MKKKELLYIENEVIDSMINSGAKARMKRMYAKMKINTRKTTSTMVTNTIWYYIRLGYSTMKSRNDLDNLYGSKLYYERNRSDTNENEIYTAPIEG